MKLACLCALLLGCGALAAQANRDAISPVTIRGNIGIQKPLTSSKFQKSFAGLYEANVSVNVRIAGNLSAGAGYQNTYFKNNEYLRRQVTTRASVPYRTSLICDAGFIRLGYDHFYKKNAFVGYALYGGYAFCRYTDVNSDTSALNLPLLEQTFRAPYIQPEISLNFVMERRLAFSFFLSYTTMLYKYDARAPRLNHFPEINERGDRFPIMYFNFGFGFTVLLGK